MGKGWLLQNPTTANAVQRNTITRRDETEPFLEKNFECLIESIEQLSQESSRFQYHQRALSRQIAQRKRQGQAQLTDDEMANNPLFKPLPEPARFDSLLITSQIGNYTNEISNFCGQGFNNHFLLRSLHQTE